MRRRALVGLALGTVLGCRSMATSASAGDRWWKGNTHTHTLWSDGDDYPEMVAGWYRAHGYDFVALSDHNTLAAEERWLRVPATGVGREALDAYRARFGDWVETRESGDTTLVRLRTPAEYRPRIAEAGRFAFVDAEEITQYLDGRAAHVTALGLAEVVPAQPGTSLVDMLRADLAILRAQGERRGRPIVGVMNHPNFLWSQTAEDVLRVPELRFMEIYNGHPLVYVDGDAVHAGNERIWDIVLTVRSARGEPLLYGVATDDAHDYHRVGHDQRNAGRGWVSVRAPRLEPDALMRAMQLGDFYASTGVELRDVARRGQRLDVAIAAEPGVTYVTEFIGSRRGADTTGVAMRDSTGRAVTRRYGADVGAVLATVTGPTAAYVLRGDELYVRARVTSSRRKVNGLAATEVERAWTQPVRP